MNYDRVLETISVEHPEIYISELAVGAAGIARKNARKHGVTAELEPRSVRDWHRIIVNNPNATMPLFDTPNDMQKLALTLAQAEVRLRRLLERYKREALLKQRKAQKAWCDQLKRD